MTLGLKGALSIFIGMKIGILRISTIKLIFKHGKKKTYVWFLGLGLGRIDGRLLWIFY
jgi:hypothetical protein